MPCCRPKCLGFPPTTSAPPPVICTNGTAAPVPAACHPCYKRSQSPIDPSTPGSPSRTSWALIPPPNRPSACTPTCLALQSTGPTLPPSLPGRDSDPISYRMHHHAPPAAALALLALALLAVLLLTCLKPSPIQPTLPFHSFVCVHC
jgi:hypothetical protein